MCYHDRYNGKHLRWRGTSLSLDPTAAGQRGQGQPVPVLVPVHTQPRRARVQEGMLLVAASQMIRRLKPW